MERIISKQSFVNLCAELGTSVLADDVQSWEQDRVFVSQEALQWVSMPYILRVSSYSHPELKTCCYLATAAEAIAWSNRTRDIEANEEEDELDRLHSSWDDRHDDGCYERGVYGAWDGHPCPIGR